MAEEITVIVDDTQEEVSLFVDSGITVDSVFGRTGNVVAVDGDYTTALVPEVTNLYYTEARVSANSAVVLNTAKDGITPAQASEITANTTTNADQSNQITTSRFEARCLGQAVDGRVDNYTSALANIGLKETSTASLLFDAKICGVGQGKLFNLLPFDSYKDFDAVRNGTATYVGSDGLIKTALANVPRIDWTDSANPVSLTEPQGTNLVLRSDELDNASWGKVRNTIIANSIASPDGTLNADSSVSTSDNNNHRNQQTIVTTVGGQYTFSSYVKKGSKDFAYLVMEQTSPADNDSAYFDIQNGVVGSLGSNLSSSSIIDVGNGWYRISTTKNSATGGGKLFHVCFASSDLNPVFTGDGSTVDGYIWGAQLETGDTATSYIPTEGTTVTRIADVVTGAGSVNDFNSEEGVLFVEMAALSNDMTNRAISISDGTSSNVVKIRFTSSSNRIQAIVSSGGSTQAISTSDSYTVTDFNKIAFKYKENDFALWINGVEVATDTSGTTFSANTLNKISLDRGYGGSSLFAKIRQLKVYKTALTDAELLALTTP